MAEERTAARVVVDADGNVTTHISTSTLAPVPNGTAGEMLVVATNYRVVEG